MTRAGVGLFLLCAAIGMAAPATSETGAPAPQMAFKAALATKAPLLGIARAGTRLVVVGDYGVIILSDDGGKSWRQATSAATRNTLTSVTFVDTKLGWAVGHSGTVLNTVDGGENWTQMYSAGPDVALLSVWFENAHRGIATGAFGFAMETDDGGHTWKEFVVAQGDDRDRHLNGIFALPGGPLFIAAEAGTLFRSVDGGRTWTTLRLPYNGSLWGGLPSRDGGAIVFGMRGHALHTADQGRSWTEAPSGTDQSFSGGVQLADGTIVLVGLGGVVARSIDGGRRFQATIRPERQTYAAVGEGAPGQLVIVGLNGVTTYSLAAK